MRGIEMNNPEWIKAGEAMPAQGEYVLCVVESQYGGFLPPFVAWHDGVGFVGLTNYRPRVDYWQRIDYPAQERTQA